MTSREADIATRFENEFPGTIICQEPPTGAGFAFGTRIVGDQALIVPAVDPFYLTVLADHLTDEQHLLFLDGLVAWFRHVLDTVPAGQMPDADDYGNSRYWLAVTHPVLGAALDSVLELQR